MSGSLPGLLQSLSCWVARGGAADWWRGWRIWPGTDFTKWSHEGAKHKWDNNIVQYSISLKQYHSTLNRLLLKKTFSLIILLIFPQTRNKLENVIIMKLFSLFSYNMTKLWGYFKYSGFSRRIRCFGLHASVCICFAVSDVLWVIHVTTSSCNTFTNQHNAFVWGVIP